MIHLTSDQLKELRDMADIFKDRPKFMPAFIPFEEITMGPYKGLKLCLREDNSLEVSE